MIRKINKVVSVLVMIALLMNASGCWGRIELDDLGIIVAMGIDREEEGFTMTLHIIKSQENGGDQAAQMGNIWVGSSSGQTLFDAAKNFRARASARLTWMHNTIIIIGEETAKGGIDDIVDFLTRNREIRFGNWLIVTQGKAKEALQVTPELHPTLFEEINGLIDNQDEWAKQITKNLRDVVVNLSNPFMDIVTARMILLDPEVMGSHDEETDEMTKATIQQVILLDGASVFKGGRLKGWLTKTETRSVLFLKGEASEALMVVPYKGGNLSLEVGGVESELNIMLHNGSPKVEAKISGQARLAETTVPLDFTTLDEIKDIEKLLNQKVAGEIHTSIDKFRGQYNADILGVGNQCFNEHPKWWLRNKDRWYSEIYPQMEFDIRVDITIDNTGLLFNPIMGGE